MGEKTQLITIFLNLLHAEVICKYETFSLEDHIYLYAIYVMNYITDMSQMYHFCIIDKVKSLVK